MIYELIVVFKFRLDFIWLRLWLGRRVVVFTRVIRIMSLEVIIVIVRSMMATIASMVIM